MSARCEVVANLLQAASAAVLLAGGVSAAVPSPPHAGISEHHGACPPLRPAHDAIDRLAIREMAAQHVPGMSVAIIRRDKAPVVRSYGYADLESCVPATTETLFGIGSLSKQFTAAGALVLVREGRLSLDDPITRFLPEGKGKWDGVRVRDLLTHTSGIPDYAGDDSKYPSIELDRTSNPPTAELVSRIAKAPLNFRPEEDWAYSNTGYLLLSVLIERVSNQPFPSFMHDHVFAPLGMISTRYYSPLELIPKRGTPYHEDEAGVVTHGPFISDQFSRWGDTGMISSASDMRRWLLALGTDKLLPKSLWAQMLTPVTLKDGTRYPYGFGIQLDQVGQQVGWTHSGTFRVGYSAMLMKFPDSGLGVVDLSNSYTDGLPMGRIATKLVEAQSPELVASLDRKAPDPRPRLTDELLKLLEGKTPSEGAAAMTDRFRAHDPLHRTAAAILGEMKPNAVKLVFLGCAPAGAKLPWPALGTPVERQCAYRLQGVPSAPRLDFWLTADNVVAGLSAW